MRTLGARAAVIAGLLVSIPAAGAWAQSAGTPAQPATSPVANDLRAELVLTGDRNAPAHIFYEQRGHRPLWLSGEGEPTPAARSLIAWAGEADAHGLPPARYGVDALAERLDEGGAQAAAALELDLTQLFLGYARDISSGLLEPSEVGRQIHIEPRRPDPAQLLASAAGARDIGLFLTRLAPSSPDYDRLVGLYGTVRETARNGGWGPEIPGGPTLRLGDRSPRVEQIRARLIALGDLPTVEQVATNEVMTDARPVHDDPRAIDPALEAAIRHFQERHGLNTDGAVGPMTLAALNVPAEKRAEQIAVNLERMRWLNRDFGSRHVMINTAGFTMTLYEDGAARFTTRTVVGKARRHETPEFIDTLEHLVVNPSWNVPRSIATEEILPELREDPTYLARNNMELVGVDVPATEIDWTQITSGTFPGRIRQRPGPSNALGRVKFMFPNKYAIYMHDTPARRLFERDRRDFSHGCVRLQDPIEFAHILLGDQTDDPAGYFERLRGMRSERWVTLERPMPVVVGYRTAWVAEDGTWQFRGDIYGRDGTVAAALRDAGVAIVGG